MRSSMRYCVLGLWVAMLCQPQQTGGDPLSRPPRPEGTRIPPPDDVGLSTPNAQERALQWAHEENLEDTSRLVKLSQELKWELANNDRTVLSMATVKKMDEIERLIKKIRARVGKK